MEIYDFVVYNYKCRYDIVVKLRGYNMKEKRKIASDLDYISKTAPGEYEEIINLIKYTKKLTELKLAKEVNKNA